MICLICLSEVDHDLPDLSEVDHDLSDLSEVDHDLSDLSEVDHDLSDLSNVCNTHTIQPCGFVKAGFHHSDRFDPFRRLMRVFSFVLWQRLASQATPMARIVHHVRAHSLSCLTCGHRTCTSGWGSFFFP